MYPFATTDTKLCSLLVSKIVFVSFKVNENFSQVLINEVEPIVVKERVVSCDGGKSLSFIISSSSQKVFKNQFSQGCLFASMFYLLYIKACFFYFRWWCFGASKSLHKPGMKHSIHQFLYLNIPALVLIAFFVGYLVFLNHSLIATVYWHSYFDQYILQDQDGPHSCGYCGLRFVKEGHWPLSLVVKFDMTYFWSLLLLMMNDECYLL